MDTWDCGRAVTDVQIFVIYPGSNFHSSSQLMSFIQQRTKKDCPCGFPHKEGYINYDYLNEVHKLKDIMSSSLTPDEYEDTNIPTQLCEDDVEQNTQYDAPEVVCQSDAAMQKAVDEEVFKMAKKRVEDEEARCVAALDNAIKDRQIFKLPKILRRSEPIDLTCTEEMPPPAPKKRKGAQPESEKKKKLKINAKKLLITIARCQVDLQAVANAFEDKWGICQYKIVKELHKDGFPHIHAGLKFEEPKRVSNNYITIEGTEYAMNFMLARKDKGGWKGWIHTYMEKAPIETLCTLKEALNLMAAENDKELLSLLTEEVGMRQAMISWDRIYACWIHFHKTKSVFIPTFPLDSFRIPFFLKSVQVDLVGLNTRRQVVILIGPTRLGKTQMIRTMFQNGHGYCRGRHRLDEWRTTSGPMILDDLADGQLGSTTKPPDKAWTDSQTFSMTGKYKPTIQCQARQVFILTNDDPIWLRDAYWITNAHVIRITGKCF